MIPENRKKGNKETRVFWEIWIKLFSRNQKNFWTKYLVMGPPVRVDWLIHVYFSIIIPYWRAFPFVCRDVISWECYYFHNFSKTLWQGSSFPLYYLLANKTMNQVTVGLAMLIAIGADGKSDRNHEFSSDFIPNSISLGRLGGIRHRCHKKKFQPRSCMLFFATGILSFCGVAGETAMNITFPILIEGIWDQYRNRPVGHHHLSSSGCLCGPLVCLSQTLF